MAAFQTIKPQPNPSWKERDLSEVRYWKRFRTQIVHQLGNVGSHVSFAEGEGADFAITNGARVSVFNGVSGALRRAYVGFKEEALCGVLRADGRILVSGSKEGAVRVYRAGARGTLRSWREHRGVVGAVDIVDHRVVSGGDDGGLRVWDIAGEESVWHVDGAHADYVRCVGVRPGGMSEYVSGGFDGVVRVWDSRESGGKFGVEALHGNPVNCVRCLPSGTSVLSGGGAWVKLWDLRSPKEPVAEVEAHAKGVMSVVVDGSGGRAVTGGLDSSFRVLDLSDGSLRVLYSQRTDAPIRALAISSNASKLVLAADDNTATIKARVGRRKDIPAPPPSKSALIRGGTRAYYDRGASSAPAAESSTFKDPRTPRFRGIDMHLKKFAYGKALDIAAQENNGPLLAATITDLQDRNGLVQALSNRSASQLAEILAPTINILGDPRFFRAASTLLTTLLDLYAPNIGHSPRLDALLRRARAKLDTASKLRSLLHRNIGFLAASTHTHEAAPEIARAGTKRPLESPPIDAKRKK